jgi:hypothetical protein
LLASLVLNVSTQGAVAQKYEFGGVLTNKSVNVGNEIPRELLFSSMDRCGEKGCNFTKEFNYVTHENGCPERRNGTIKVEGHYNGWDMASRLQLQLKHTIQKIQGKTTIRETGSRRTRDPGGPTIRECYFKDSDTVEWEMPSELRITIYKGKAISGWIQYKVMTSSDKIGCPAVFGTMTSLIMTVPHPISGVVGNGFNFLCSILLD